MFNDFEEPEYYELDAEMYDLSDDVYDLDLYTSDLCPRCNGSGEGMFDGSTCDNCRGTGEVRVLISELDEETEDE
jgi:DnaJ-class molecular chaperone